METLTLETPWATNDEIARILFQVASLLELIEGNPYRIRAYRRAALGVLYLPKPLAEYVASHESIPLPGAGDGMQRRLVDLVNTGSMGVYETLLDDVGEPLVSLLRVHGIGPKTAIRLIRELGVGSLQDLVVAAREGRIQTLRGFGAIKETQFRMAAENVLTVTAA